MSIEITIAALLGLAVLVECACAVGLLLMENALDRLHFLGPATILGPLAVVAAALLRSGVEQTSIKASLVLVLSVLAGPVLSYVVARAVVERSERS